MSVEERIRRISNLNLCDPINYYVKTLWDSGYLSDPREAQKVRPIIFKLLITAPRSPERIVAVTAMVESLRQRQTLTERVSVYAAVAEIQMMQTMLQYLEVTQTDVRNPDHRIDAVEIFRLYEKLLAQGELITPATVQGWLQEWDVPSMP